MRGFPSAMAVLSTNGMEMANTGNPQGASRVFQFKELSINNLSRLEVTKVLTPAYARRYQEMTHGVQLTLGVKGSF